MKEKVLSYLDDLKIPYEVTEHPPVLNMEEVEAVGLTKIGPVCKNLFLRDQKGKRHFLVTASEETQISLKELGEKLGVKLSFASAERLQKYLGVSTGSVSPMGVLNDADHAVEVILDQKLQGQPKLGVHPNENTTTIWLSFSNLQKALKKAGNDVKIMKL